MNIPIAPLFLAASIVLIPCTSKAASLPAPLVNEMGAPTSSVMDMSALNQYWLEKINDLREKKGREPLVLDVRLMNTATEWATYMGKKGVATHVRPDGVSMHTWIDRKNLTFTERNRPGGWKRSYFTENIAWGYTDTSLASATSSLEKTLQFFLKEAKTNGPHYRTIYHPDWNSIGVGFFFKPIGKGRYEMYTAFHYGSLAQR